MNVRTFAVVLALALLAGFTAQNWVAFTAPTTLTVGITEVQAPLGLVMLMVCAVLATIFLGYIVFQQAGVILEARRMSKELKSQRELADRAEASRFTELRGYLAGELERIVANTGSATDGVNTRIDRLEAALRERLAESERSLTAYVGEVEDKLDRLLPPGRG